jgi:acetyl-CoA carboxylase biotin carboxyl carrier protein
LAVKNAYGALSDEEVRQLTLLIEALDRSGFDFLQLGVGDMTLTLSKGTPPPAQMTAIPTSGVATAARVLAPTDMPTAAVARAPSPPTVIPASPPTAASTAPSGVRTSEPSKTDTPEDGTLDIKAPLTGLFYSKPDPALPPFVTVGTLVSEGSTVCLIEIMKVFNAVPAGVAGMITQICARDAEIVEAGQTLFRVRPAGNAA